MATTIGSTGSSGSPCIRIKISGAFTSKTQEFEATVDTGFTGFISMPIMSALPLGLPLYGTTSVQFGDGKTSTRFTALGVAELGNESEAGVVILEPSTSTILVGMEFLTAFKKTIFLHRRRFGSAGPERDGQNTPARCCGSHQANGSSHRNTD